MDQVTQHPLQAVTNERHLEEGAFIRMTHAATNTTGSVGHIRPHSMTITTSSRTSALAVNTSETSTSLTGTPYIQGSQKFHINSAIRETIMETPPPTMQTPPKKKRGPKAGRKAALALAAAAAAAASAEADATMSSSVANNTSSSSSTSSSSFGKATWITSDCQVGPTGTMKSTTSTQGDPYAFSCNDATPTNAAINYETQTETTFTDRRLLFATTNTAEQHHHKHERLEAANSGVGSCSQHHNNNNKSRQTSASCNTSDDQASNTCKIKLQNQQHFRQSVTSFNSSSNIVINKQNDDSSQLNETNNNRFQHFQQQQQQQQQNQHQRQLKRHQVFDYKETETETETEVEQQSVEYQYSNSRQQQQQQQINKQQYVTFKRPPKAGEESFHMIAHKQHPIAAVAQSRKTVLTHQQLHQHQQPQQTTQMHHHNHLQQQQQHVVVGSNVQQQQQQYYQQSDYQSIGNQIVDQQPPQLVYQQANEVTNQVNNNTFTPNSHHQMRQVVHHQIDGPIKQQPVIQSQKPQPIQAQQQQQQYHVSTVDQHQQQQTQPQVPPQQQQQQLPYHHHHQHPHPHLNQHQQQAQYEQQALPITSHHQQQPLLQPAGGQHYAPPLPTQAEQVHVQRSGPAQVPQPVPVHHHQAPPVVVQQQAPVRHQNPIQPQQQPQVTQRIQPYQTNSGNQQVRPPVCSSTVANTRPLPGTINHHQHHQAQPYRAQQQQQQQHQQAAQRCLPDNNSQMQHIQQHQIPSQHQLQHQHQHQHQQQLVSPNSNYSATSYVQTDISQNSFQLEQEQYPSSSPTLLQQQLNRQSSAQTQTQHQQRLGPVVSCGSGATTSSRNPQQATSNAYKTGRSGVAIRGGPFNSEPNMINNEHFVDQQQQHNVVLQRPAMMNPSNRLAPIQEPPQTQLPAPPPHHHHHQQQMPNYQAPRAQHQQQQQQQRRQPQQVAQNMISEQQQHHTVAMLGNPTPPLTPISSSNMPMVSNTTAGARLNSPLIVNNGQQPYSSTLSNHPTNVPQAMPDSNNHWPPQLQHDHVQGSTIVYNNGQIPPNSNGAPKQPTQNHHLHQQLQDTGSSNGATQVVARIMPKNQQHQQHDAGYHSQQQQAQYQQQTVVGNKQHLNNHHHHHPPPHHHHQTTPTSQLPSQLNQQGPNPMHHQHNHQMAEMPTNVRNNSNVVGGIVELPPSQTRLTLPLSDSPVLGPFRLEHDAQFTSKVFHIKPQLFEALSKSMNLINPQTASVIQELQFRAYLIKQQTQQSNCLNGGDSLLLAAANVQGRACNWPELFQVSINQNILNLDRSSQSTKLSSPQQQQQHKAIDVFQFCRLGNNVIDIQVNDCYCSHEFVLEAVDRPTIKAFMNSCFKSRLLSIDSCIQKLKFNFNTPGFLIQNNNNQQLQNAGIFNEHVIEFNQGIEVTKSRISLRCPISCQRMRTPTRGHNCKHLQCFDLEKFLFVNRERSQWYCPICSLSIPFNMLELDQHQMNIIQAMSDTLNTDDILMDSNGQWQAYYAGMGQQQQQQVQKQPIPVNNIPANQPQQQQPVAALQNNTAKSTGTYHPQAPIMNGTSPQGNQNHQHQQALYMQQHQPQPQHNQQQQPMRPMSGSALSNRNTTQAQQVGSPASWDGSNHVEMSLMNHQHQHHQQQQPQMARGSISTAQPLPGRRSANGSPLAKKPYAGQYAQQRGDQQPQQHVVVQQQQANSQYIGDHSSNNSTPATTQPFNSQQLDNSDDLSPLAAMERTIIQHEQQMGPPPFDPNSLTSSPAPLRTAATTSGGSALISSQSPSSTATTSQQSVSNQQQTQQQSAGTPTGIQPPLVQASPEARPQLNASRAYSPAANAVSSPAARMTPAISSPQQARIQQTDLPQSPLQQLQQQQQQQQAGGASISTPATPSSSSILIHGGPETPATPSQLSAQQQQQHCGPNSVSAVTSLSPHISSNTSSSSGGALSGTTNQQQTITGVDHQPLSNGSASAGSITSTSTMTPSGQSLGSVGMGGDSRCGTAPLQVNGPLGLDDLMLPGCNSGGGGVVTGAIAGISSTSVAGGSSSQYSASNSNSKHSMLHNNHHSSSSHHHHHHHLDEKNDILMGKLMMDSSESLLRDHRNSELAIALEEAEWKQQLDRGKSEHLANFLNEPLMNSKHANNRTSTNNYGQQQQQQQQTMVQIQDSNKLISGGLNPSDDEANHSHNSSPSHNLDQLEFANYLDSDTVDNGAGLPPDDSILDLFER